MTRKFIVLAFVTSFILAPNVFAQTRIRFAQGRSSASATGLMGKGSVRRFVVAAQSRHELTGSVASPTGCVRFTRGSTIFRLTTEREDNWISITNYCNRPSVFNLTVSK